MLQYYYAPRVCSFAGHCVINELALDVDLHKVDLKGGEQHSEAYRKINHLGRVPVLIDGDFVLTESPAILYYLAENFGGQRLIPQDRIQKATQNRWMAYLASTVHPYFGASFRPERFAHDESLRPHVSQVARERYNDEMRWIESKLTQNTFLFGKQPALVDFYLLVFLRWAGISFDVEKELPNCFAQAQRMAEWPSVAKTLEAEGLPLFWSL